MTKQLNKKQRLRRTIRDNNQTMWFGIIIMILTFWTGIGLIIGLIIAIVGGMLKSSNKIKLADLEDKATK